MRSKKDFSGRISYEEFYGRSDIRKNLLEWLRLPRGGRVLAVNEPDTCLVDLLRRNVGAVDVASEEDVREKAAGSYQVIFQMGTLRCGDREPSKVYGEYFSMYRELLSPDGVFLLAVPNRLGLRYFAGCADEDTGRCFSGPEGYPQIEKGGRRALSQKEYGLALEAAGFCGVERYYPYPDHCFPMTVYSDGRLPESGELDSNIRNFHDDRYVIFDETRVFDSIIKEGLFPEFSNSFLYICHAKPIAAREKVLYAKYSNERERRFQIRTDIVQKADGSRYVRKCPLCKEAEAHVRKMRDCYGRLRMENGESTIHFCSVDMEGDAAVFSFAQGDSVQRILRRLVEEKRIGEAEEYLKTVIGRMRGYLEKRTPQNGALTNLDMVFSNILVGDGGWNLIDYEWTFDAEIPADFVIYRALFRASIELPKCPLTKLPALLALAGITEERAARFADWEMKFQDYITGKQIPARDMVEYLGNQVKPFPANKTYPEREAERLIWSGQGEAVKICFSIDMQGNRNGRAFCSGWACAKRTLFARQKRRRYIPVKIQIVEESGAELECQLHRTLRPDVKNVLRASETDYEIWGFDAAWTARENVRYKIRFSAGRQQREIELSGVRE